MSSRSLNIYKPINNKEEKQIVHKYNDFFKSLFSDVNYQNIVEQQFFRRNEFGIVSSIITVFKIDDKKKGIDGYIFINNYDKQFSIYKVEKEIKLSYPSEIEAKTLNINSDEMVVIEKNKIIDINNRVIRYEEEVFKPNSYHYEG